MVKTSAKGARNEFRAKKELLEDGFEVESVKRLQYGPTDFFGLWDIIAVSSKQVRFIQVKSNRLPERRDRRRMHLFRCPHPCTKEVWVWIDYKGWRKFILDKGEMNEYCKIRERN